MKEALKRRSGEGGGGMMDTTLTERSRDDSEKKYRKKKQKKRKEDGEKEKEWTRHFPIPFEPMHCIEQPINGGVFPPFSPCVYGGGVFTVAFFG